MRRLLVVLFLVATVGAISGATPSAAAGNGGCAGTWGKDHGKIICIVDNPGSPGSPGNPGNGSGSNVCTHNGVVLACYVQGWGFLDMSDGCYYLEDDPQPPVSDPIWNGHKDGAIWVRRCVALDDNRREGVSVWIATPPPGQTSSPADVAREMIASETMNAIPISLVPYPGNAGLVGLPIWLWFISSPDNWRSWSLDQNAPGIEVKATGVATQVTWNMGDGHSVVCRTPGTPWTPSDKAKQSPTCGYVYSRPSSSRPGGTYTVTATTTWSIKWWTVGGGPSATETYTPSSSTTVTINELQVLTR